MARGGLERLRKPFVSNSLGGKPGLVIIIGRSNCLSKAEMSLEKSDIEEFWGLNGKKRWERLPGNHLYLTLYLTVNFEVVSIFYEADWAELSDGPVLEFGRAQAVKVRPDAEPRELGISPRA